MNTTDSSLQEFPFDPSTWLFTAIFSVAISGFLTLWAGFHFHWSDFALGLAVPFATSLFSFLAQVVFIGLPVRNRFFRWLPWLLVGSVIGWAISLLIVYQVSQLGYGLYVLGKLDFEVGINGFAGGGAIGLPPGILLGIVYAWLMRPYSKARLLLVNNALGWFYGMGLASACFLMLLPFITSPIF